MRTMQSLALVFALTAAVTLQAQEMTEEEILRLPTYVVVLNDGEQLVIRGSYEVRDGLVVFYLDHGSHPVFSSVLEETVDFEATESANQWLSDEREREARFWRLIEERQRRMLEEVDSRPVVITSQSGLTIEEEEQQPAVTVEEAEQFPPYDNTRLAMEPEVWWRNESARLFAALDASNLRLAELQRRHDEIAQIINRARSESQAAPHQQELLEVRKALLAEREKARLVGNRLTDLSIAAEELAKPLDWLLPTGAAVIDESSGAGFAGEPAGDIEIPSYNAAELEDAPDSWWAEERNRLEGAQREARQRMVSLRERYNQLLAERNAEQSEVRIIQLNQQIGALDTQISDQNARLQALDAAYNQLLAVARELGKEEALGLMRER